MDLTPIMQSLASSSPIVLGIFAVLGSLVVVGQVIVGLTPSKADDAAWEKIKAFPIVGPVISALSGFAYFQKK